MEYNLPESHKNGTDSKGKSFSKEYFCYAPYMLKHFS